MANLKDVAQLAGVSMMTVSRVLNGKGVVAEDTKQRVLECARQLNYQPNAIARSLVLNRTSTIGIVVCHLENPVYAQYVAAIAEELRANGYDIILASAETTRTWVEAIRTVITKQVDGLILASLQFDGWDENPIPWAEAQARALAMINGANCPVVCTGNMAVFDDTIDRICPDYREGMRLSARMLLEAGHRKIGRFCFETPWIERNRGFTDVMDESGLIVPEKWCFRGEIDRVEIARKRAKEWLRNTDELPTAVCCDNDTLAVGLMQALGEACIRVPDDISVIGNDGNIFSICTSPRLTTVSIRPYEVGKVVARRLLERMNKQMPAELILVSPEYQEGGTVKVVRTE